MQVKIASNKLTVVKNSLNPVEANMLEKTDFGLGSIDGFLSVKETPYTYELHGYRTTLYDFLFKMSNHCDIELM